MLNAPNISLSTDGYASWDFQQHVDYYEMLLDDSYLATTGNLGVYLPGYASSISVRACCSCSTYRKSEFSNTLYFDLDNLDSKYNTLPFNADSIEFISVDNDYSIFQILGSDNIYHKFKGYNFSIENGQMKLKEDGYIFSINSISKYISIFK